MGECCTPHPAAQARTFETKQSIFLPWSSAEILKALQSLREGGRGFAVTIPCSSRCRQGTERHLLLT